MLSEQLTTPVLFIIFNRPKETERVFSAIRRVKPAQLFIAADGPRTGIPSDVEKCATTRKYTENIDWPCEVKRLYQDKNLGCKIGVSTAINWFFDHVEEGIVLEDDCLPSDSFFTFCTSMLEMYRDEKQVMAINGTCMLTQEELGTSPGNYHFSRCLHVWGWATWRRAWKKYDIDMNEVEKLKTLQFSEELFDDKKHLSFWIQHFKHIRDKHIDTWDAQWHYSILKNDGFVIYPHHNMIENIGFGSDATHTTTKNPYLLPITNPEIHYQKQDVIKMDTELDARLMNKVYIKSILQKIIYIFFNK